jgi:hypothetical protein
VSTASQRDWNERRDIAAFRALVAAPADLGTVAAGATSLGFVMPGRGRLAASSSVAQAAAASLAVNVGDRLAFTVPVLAADQVHRGATGERGMEVTVTRASGAGADAGTVTIHVVDPLGRHLPVATATFT